MSNEDRTKVQATIPGKREQIATRVAFFIGGFASAVWAPLIPFAKQRLHLDDGGLGLLILCFGLGSLSTMALAGWAAGRFGCRRVIRLGTLLACLALPFLATLSSTIPFVVALLLFGSAIGAIDVTVNVQAVIVEKAGGRPLMSGFHAGWSIGGFAGAILLTGLFSLGLQPWMAVLVPIIAILALHFLFASGLLPYANESSEKQKFAFPHGIILAIGALCFISFLAEGAILDWGGVFLTSNKNVAIAYAGLGYAGFSLTMLICRLTGDRIVHRIGGFRVLLFGGLIGAAGFAAVILAPSLWTMVVGFALIGIGMSNIVPVLFSLTGKQNRMPAHQAVSVVGTIAYTGILLGPAIIGGIAKVSSLSVGLAIVATMVLVIAASSFLAKE